MANGILQDIEKWTLEFCNPYQGKILKYGKRKMTFISFELSRKGCNFFVSKMLIFSLTLAEIIKDSSGVSLPFAPTFVNNQKKVEIHYKFSL